MTEPIMQKIATTNRPKVNRDSSVKAAIAPTTTTTPTTSPNELEKKTVRISGEAIAYYAQLKTNNKITLDGMPIAYYAQLKTNNKITLDGMLEAIAIYSKQHPEVEQELIEIGKQVLRTRQESANTARATTMYEKYRQA